MASNGHQSNPYPYATPDTPRDLTDDELSFLSRYSGEKDLDKLRDHVINVWKSVKSQLWIFACIQRFMFLKPRIITHSFYPDALRTMLHGESAIFLDIGCCFGQDTRQLILDGVPAGSIVATDITPDYWNFGKELFMDKSTLKVHSAFGSFTDPAFIASSTPAGPLGHLVGRVNIAWAGAVLHVLSAEDVRAFATNVHAILAPGGVWFGYCVGCEPPSEWAATPNGKGRRFLHSPSSLQSLLQSVGFSEADVCATERVDEHEDAPGQMLYLSFTAKK